MSDSRLAGGQVASVGARALERADWFRGLRAWSQWRQWLRDRWRTRGLGLHGRGPSGPGGFPAPALEFPATTQDACSEFPGVEPPPPAPDMQAELSSAPTLRAPIVRRRETALAPRAALTGARELAAPVQPAVQRERERLGASIAPVERPEPRPLASEWPRSVPATKSVVTQRRSPGERQAPVPPRASTSATATTTARTTTTSTVSTSVRRQQSQSSATPRPFGATPPPTAMPKPVAATPSRAATAPTAAAPPPPRVQVVARPTVETASVARRVGALRARSYVTELQSPRPDAAARSAEEAERSPASAAPAEDASNCTSAGSPPDEVAPAPSDAPQPAPPRPDATDRRAEDTGSAIDADRVAPSDPPQPVLLRDIQAPKQDQSATKLARPSPQMRQDASAAWTTPTQLRQDARPARTTSTQPHQDARAARTTSAQLHHDARPARTTSAQLRQDASSAPIASALTRDDASSVRITPAALDHTEAPARTDEFELRPARQQQTADAAADAPSAATADANATAFTGGESAPTPQVAQMRTSAEDGAVHTPSAPEERVGVAHATQALTGTEATSEPRRRASAMEPAAAAQAGGQAPLYMAHVKTKPSIEGDMFVDNNESPTEEASASRTGLDTRLISTEEASASWHLHTLPTSSQDAPASRPLQTANGSSEEPAASSHLHTPKISTEEPSASGTLRHTENVSADGGVHASGAMQTPGSAIEINSAIQSAPVELNWRSASPVHGSSDAVRTYETDVSPETPLATQADAAHATANSAAPRHVPAATTNEDARPADDPPNIARDTVTAESTPIPSGDNSLVSLGSAESAPALDVNFGPMTTRVDSEQGLPTANAIVGQADSEPAATPVTPLTPVTPASRATPTQASPVGNHGSVVEGEQVRAERPVSVGDSGMAESTAVQSQARAEMIDISSAGLHLPAKLPSSHEGTEAAAGATAETAHTSSSRDGAATRVTYAFAEHSARRGVTSNVENVGHPHEVSTNAEIFAAKRDDTTTAGGLGGPAAISTNRENVAASRETAANLENVGKARDFTTNLENVAPFDMMSAHPQTVRGLRETGKNPENVGMPGPMSTFHENDDARRGMRTNPEDVSATGATIAPSQNLPAEVAAPSANSSAGVEQSGEPMAAGAPLARTDAAMVRIEGDAQLAHLAPPSPAAAEDAAVGTRDGGSAPQDFAHEGRPGERNSERIHVARGPHFAGDGNPRAETSGLGHVPVSTTTDGVAPNAAAADGPVSTTTDATATGATAAEESVSAATQAVAPHAVAAEECVSSTSLEVADGEKVRSETASASAVAEDAGVRSEAAAPRAYAHGLPQVASTFPPDPPDALHAWRVSDSAGADRERVGDQPSPQLMYVPANPRDGVSGGVGTDTSPTVVGTDPSPVPRAIGIEASTTVGGAGSARASSSAGRGERGVRMSHAPSRPGEASVDSDFGGGETSRARGGWASSPVEANVAVGAKTELVHSARILGGSAVHALVHPRADLVADRRLVMAGSARTLSNRAAVAGSEKASATVAAVANPDAFKVGTRFTAVANPDAFRVGTRFTAVANPDAFRVDTRFTAVANPDAFRVDTGFTAAVSPEAFRARPAVPAVAAPEAFWARPSDTFGRPHEARAVSQAAPAAPVSVSPPLTIQRTTTSVMSPSSYATAAGTSSALSAAQQLTHAHTQGLQQPHMQGQAQPHMQGQGQAQPHMQWHGQGLPAVQRVQTDSGSASERASGSVDAHALARQVYRILKHRLLLERERSGAWRSR